MKLEKLKQIVARKNEQLEDEAVRSASEIINEIADLHASKLEADKQIAALREKLKGLEVQQIDETSILGN